MSLGSQVPHRFRSASTAPTPFEPQPATFASGQCNVPTINALALAVGNALDEHTSLRVRSERLQDPTAFEFWIGDRDLASLGGYDHNVGPLHTRLSNVAGPTAKWKSSRLLPRLPRNEILVSALRLANQEINVVLG